MPELEPFELKVDLDEDAAGKAMKDIEKYIPLAEQIGIEIGEALTSGIEKTASQAALLIGNFIGDSATSKKMMDDQLNQVKSHYGRLIDEANRNGADTTKIRQEMNTQLRAIEDDFSLQSRADDFGRSVLNMLGSFMQEFGTAIIAIGIAKTGLDAAISTGNAPLAIVAGIALVAAGAALSNISKAGVDGGGQAPSPAPNAPAPDYSGGGQMGSNSYTMQTQISGRDIQIVTQREKAFRR